ncbi:metal-dependent hydrolase [Knoellia sinensis KCTC 19936]|uniref:Metal-dependent hydrolase n=1 Tax=Knoellia sinensis KCTC 19936 TaxID=1385520 RepID=A0A0A0JGP2_9MICO|nr:MBL fold metallo-hydrolase [Knoellia sinensis]KGN34796.1 metal-dependent hydrolase [Knoellia sinensis KCTC 19936]
MKVTVIGCSGSFAGPDSPASSYLVTVNADGRAWNVLFDLGSGALGPLHRHVAPSDLDAVFLTHLHPDHCADVCGLYVSRNYAPDGAPSDRLPVWGPAETATRVSLMYHGLEDGDMEKVFVFEQLEDQVPVTVGPVTITPYAVHHPVEAFGFRVEADGAVLAYTGDTDSCDNLVPLMTGADLVLADSAFVDGRDEVRGVHLTASRAAEAAREAGGVQRLVLTHMPAWNDPDVCRAQAESVWPGVEVARAGDIHDLGKA